MKTESLPLPINLPINRQTLYPSEVTQILSVDDKQLRALEADGTLVSINIACAGCRPVRRYTIASLEEFLRRRNSRDNPDHQSLPRRKGALR